MSSAPPPPPPPNPINPATGRPIPRLRRVTGRITDQTRIDYKLFTQGLLTPEYLEARRIREEAEKAVERAAEEAALRKRASFKEMFRKSFEERAGLPGGPRGPDPRRLRAERKAAEAAAAAAAKERQG